MNKPALIFLALSILSMVVTVILIASTVSFSVLAIVLPDEHMYNIPSNCTVITPRTKCETVYNRRGNTIFCSAIVCLDILEEHEICPDELVRTTLSFSDKADFYNYKTGFNTTCFENDINKQLVSYVVYSEQQAHWTILAVISGVGVIVCIALAIYLLRFYLKERSVNLARYAQHISRDEEFSE